MTRRLGSGSVWDRLDLGDAAATGWMRYAVCAQTDPEAYFPGMGQPNRSAKRVCAVCPVQAECLAYALDRHEFGVWGGTSEKQRNQLRRRAGEARVA